jgi:hypothetical protein
MDYKQTADDALRRRAELLERQQFIRNEKKKLSDEAERIQRELVALEQILEGLNFMSSEILADVEPKGLTDSIRQILSETTVPLSPTQIRDQLELRGIMGSSPKILLISVHKVLERIDPELNKGRTQEGKMAYMHKSTSQAPKKLAPAVDLMAALKRSLAQMEENTKIPPKRHVIPRAAGAVNTGGPDLKEEHDKYFGKK